jgi:hypothetical protein
LWPAGIGYGEGKEIVFKKPAGILCRQRMAAELKPHLPCAAKARSALETVTRCSDFSTRAAKRCQCFGMVVHCPAGDLRKAHPLQFISSVRC